MHFSRLVVCCTLIGSLLAACQSSSETTTTALPQPTQLSGRQLSQGYCGSCHLMPDPSLLDKTTWQKGIFPQMALRMGQSSEQMTALSSFANANELTRIIQANIFPEKPLLHPTDWQKIIAYYTASAPDRLPRQRAHMPVRPGLPLFSAHQSNQAIDAMVTLLTYDSVAHRIWTGDQRGHLYALDRQLRRTDSVQLSSPPTDLRANADGSFDVLTVGVLNPNDQLAGTWSHLASASATPQPQLQNLQRPVQSTAADLNRDGRTDVVVCQFGHYLGKLTWHERLATGYREHVLDDAPGARVALVRDVNNDQWPDVVALLTQGNEQVAVYYNQRNGQFRKEVVLRFPPVYGSSYLELTDMNGDGNPDLVYTNGDNADYSLVLKPYHGVRVFLNDGSFRFKEAWFYPMYGATQTVVRDFDQDGDPDIAAIAQFPDFAQQPGESFVYFENQGRLRFVPRTFPLASRGRWLLITAADVDQDGDDDLLLGSFFRPVRPEHARLMEYWRKPGAGIMLLRNEKR